MKLPETPVNSSRWSKAVERLTSGRQGFRAWGWLGALIGALSITAFGVVLANQEPPDRLPQAQTADQAQFQVVIRKPAGPPLVATGTTNFLGEPAMVSCGTCHTTLKPNIEVRSAAELDQFHQGLKFAHGNLSCLSCHNASDYESLRLADSRALQFSDSMELCSQCHGPQRRDYEMGLHGGMNGHWDLKRGGRTRNTCVDCHDPHTPAFPTVMPVLAPRDRVSVPGKPHGELGHE